MANPNDFKSVTISFKGDLNTIRKDIAELEKEFAAMGVHLARAVETPLSGDMLKGRLSFANVAGTTAEELRAITEARTQAMRVNMSGTDEEKAAVGMKVLSAEAKNLTKDMKLAEAAHKRLVAGFDKSGPIVAANVIASKHSADSITAIEARAKAERIRIDQELADKLQTIRQGLGNKLVTIQQANMQRIAALGKAANARELADEKEFADKLASVRAAQYAADRAKYGTAFGVYNTPARTGDALKVTPANQRMADVNRQNMSAQMIAGMTAAAKSTDSYSKALDKTAGAIQRVQIAHKGFLATVAEFSIAYRAVNAAQQLFIDGLLNIPKAGIQFEATMAALTATFKNATAAQQEMSFLTIEAERTGIAVGALRESYAQVSASFIGAGESAERTRQIFQNINTVATTMHMNTEQTRLTYLALGQIFNKTKLQAEELTKQLSQQIPGVTNAQAEALGITVAELYDKMKKGAISAHEAVFALSEIIATRFGGEGFARAATGLNASLGRIQTAWKLLSEEIYKDNAGMLTGTVNMATGIIKWLNEVMNKIKSVIEVVGAVATGIAASSIAVYAANTAALVWSSGLTKVIANLNLAKAATGGLYGAAVGLSVGLSMLINDEEAFLKRGEDLLRKKKNAADRLKIQNTADRQRFDVETSDEVVRLKEDRDKAMDELYKMEHRQGTYAVPGADAKIAKDRQRYIAALKGFDAELNALRTKKLAELQESEKVLKQGVDAAEAERLRVSRDRSDIQAKLDAELEIVGGTKGESAAARTKRKFDKELKQIQEDLKSNDSVIREQALRQQAELNKIIDIAASKTTKSPVGALNKQLNADIRDNKRDFDKLIDQNKNALEELDIQNQNNLISWRDYFTKKQELLLANNGLERAAAEKSLAQAQKFGDTAKIEQFADKLDELRIARDKIKLDIVKESDRAALRGFIDLTDELHVKFLEMSGDSSAAAISRTLMENKRNLLEIQSNKADPDPMMRARAEAAGKELDYRIKMEGLQASMNDVSNRAKNAQDEFNNSIARTNELKQIGAIGEFQALNDTTAANETFIQQQERIVQKYEEIAAAARQADDAFMGPQPHQRTLAVDNMLQQAENARAELDNLKSHSNAVFTAIHGMITDSFSTAFASVVAGTATAKDAFNSFVREVIQGIAKMIASEMESAVFKLVKSAAGSVSWGSLLSGAVGLFAADGAAFDRGNVIPFAKGGIINRPTKFNIGMAGEAGPEAIMPLARTRNGKLGVSVQGTGDAISNVYHINVTVQSNGRESPDQLGAKVAAAVMRNIAREEIATAARPGGQLNRTRG